MEDLKKVKARIDWFCQNKVNAFSPTISPALKNIERNEIESIYEAVNYFVKHGQTEIIFQKKYMGSYCDIYLQRNLNESYFVSRNGHLITHIDLDKAIDSLKPLYEKLDWNGVSMFIIQSELLPWSALGKGLIENDFKGYLEAHETHVNTITNSSIYQKLELVKQSEAYQNYLDEKNKLSPKELSKAYPSHVIRQYNAIESFLILDVTAYEEGLKIYREQIEHFGSESELHFKPFNILKRIYENGKEEIPNDNLTYEQVNNDTFKILKIDTSVDLGLQLKPIYEWYDSLCNTMEEGIMIKPRTAFVKGLAPAFKVRNNKYLTMIYGFDFISKYDEYVGKRNIKRKLECSINDWMLNWELIKTPYKNISKENYAYKNIVLDRIFGEQIENNLDHRL